jgi:hypothetical protein
MARKIMNDQPIFHVGLCMAGAISAGAYTAGVMDFLIEALEEWEQHRTERGVPSHRVCIPIIGGASAGGMTGIITAAGLAGKIKPVKTLPAGNLFQEQPENIFYHSWVDLTQNDMFPVMLGVDDIENNKIYSALNSQFIDSIAERATTISNAVMLQRPYFYPSLKIFATLTNLKGYAFDITFKSNLQNTTPYHVQRHNDYACFQLTTGNESTDPGWIPLNFSSRVNASLAKNVAMATGAFPVGLRARSVTRKGEDVNKMEWLKDVTKLAPITDVEYTTLNVDGGLINNEPFEKVQSVLRHLTGQKLNAMQQYDTFQSTIIMIDPFPSKTPSFEDDATLKKVLGSTFSAMMGQLRTKPTALVNAMDSKLSGQYLIAPSRRDVPQFDGTSKDRQGEYAIASGTLGGFGGFLHKEFRIHDYFLGRGNCEQFLREYFTVPKDTVNQIFLKGYKGVDPHAFRNSNGDFQIIPVLKPKEANFWLPQFSCGLTWPVRQHSDIDRFEDPMKERVQKLVMNFDDYSWITSIAVWLGIKTLRGKISNTILEAIKKSLNEHQLLKLD